jgi:1-acyl-sn-glycerol-3-phosphate acyltransferase
MNSIQHNGTVIFIRSLIFQIAFYLNLTLHILLSLPAFVLPHKIMIEVARSWGRTSVWLLSAICGVRLELRGHEKIPKGPLLVASKHQSAWDTFALLPMFPYPTYVLKRELTWIPFFGWCLLKAGQIPLDRDAGKEAIANLMVRVRAALAMGRQVIVFPEGTRRPVHAPPDYKLGIVPLYVAAEVPCLPMALNSGQFWPRRKFLRPPGTIIVEYLDVIPAGLPRAAFFRRLQNDIETATNRLLAETEALPRQRPN